MTLRQLVELVNENYEGNLLTCVYDNGEPNYLPHIDALAVFIVSELADTYDEDNAKSEAWLALKEAAQTLSDLADKLKE